MAGVEGRDARPLIGSRWPERLGMCYPFAGFARTANRDGGSISRISSSHGTA
jgi:hypothetical protein